MERSVKYWLFKTEPTVFGLTDLMASPQHTTAWDGVRNYEARNILRDRIARGDLGVLYHSSCPTPAAVALLDVVRAGYPDPTATDPRHPAYDPRSGEERPRWYAVDVHLLRPFPQSVPRVVMREHPILRLSRLMQPGNRLSVLPLTRDEMKAILELAGLAPDDYLIDTRDPMPANS